MTNRYQPNEVRCPVPIDMLAHLLRVSEEQAHTVIQDLPGRQRAELAVFCYGRGHMRDLALTIAALCHETDLVRTAGAAGALIAHQVRYPPTLAVQASEPYKRIVTLALRA